MTTPHTTGASPSTTGASPKPTGALRVPVHGAVLGEAEDQALEAVIQRRWYTNGPACAAFERKLEDYTGLREAVLCNSGSSANLLALSCLSQTELGERAILPGDAVITTALNFPTTLAPILQIGAIPVLVDVDLPGLIPSIARVRAAITKRTKAVVLAHTLGNPLPTGELRELCDRHGLWLVEDACDALGSPHAFQHCDLATLSFYPAHQVCCGEGGAVLTASPRLAKIVRSLRDWGRDCWCESGQDGTCGRRWAGAYDHKYSYSRIGYHLAMTEFQAALGCVQMERLPGFVQARARNHAYLAIELLKEGMDRFFELPPAVWASWFGFCLICKAGVERNQVTKFLEERGVQTRLVFGGNLLRQPGFAGMRAACADELVNTNLVHERAFWVGCWPGLNQAQLDHVVNSIVEYCEGER